MLDGASANRYLNGRVNDRWKAGAADGGSPIHLVLVNKTDKKAERKSHQAAVIEVVRLLENSSQCFFSLFISPDML